MTAKVYQFPKVSELAHAWAELLAVKAMSLPMKEIPAYVEEHRLDAGVDMSPELWLRYILIKVARIDDELRGGRDENTG